MNKSKQLFVLALFFVLFRVGVAMAQDGVKIAEIELNPPIERGNGGSFHFSFVTGKTEWIPIKKPILSAKEQAELVMRERNPEKDPAGLDFSIMGEIDMRKVPIMILSEDEIKSILSTGVLPEKDATTKPQRMKLGSFYILKEETDYSFYIFKLKDSSPQYAWQRIEYIRIIDRQSWKENPDLSAFLNTPMSMLDVKTIDFSKGVGVLNLAENKVKDVTAAQKDLKAYYPAAAKVGDMLFFFRGRSPIRPNGTSFKRELLKAGCDFFDDVDEYPNEGDTLLLSLNKRCTTIPDNKIESLCSDPAKLVGDFYGVPMDDTIAEQPMVLLETSEKKLFLIIAMNTLSHFDLSYLEIPHDGISMEQTKAILEYRSLQRKKAHAETVRQKILQKWDKEVIERKNAEEQARQDALDKRIEHVKQLSVGDTFPKTKDEIRLVENLIVSAKYEELLKLCEGKELDFNVEGRYNLLYDSLEQNPQYRTQSFLKNKIRIMEFLLKNGCQPVVSTGIGFDCMHIAICTNNKDAFFLLLRYGYELNMKKNGQTVLDYVIDFLGKGKVDPEIVSKLRETNLSLFALVSLNDLDGVKKALQDPKNLEAINKKDDEGRTPLNHALCPDRESDLEMVRLLLDAGALLDETMLRTIIRRKKNEILLVLWEFYRDRLTKEQWFEGFLCASQNANTDAFLFFLEQGFDPLEKNRGRSAAINVFLSGPKEMVDILDQHGIKKPFWAAVRWNDLDLVKEYLAAGVDANEVDPDCSDFPIAIAMWAAWHPGPWKNYYEMAELLLQHGAYVSPEEYYRREMPYPIEFVAIQENSASMMELLLKHGFVPDFPKTPGDTRNASTSSALYMALRKRQYETAKVLLAYGARTDVTEDTIMWNALGQPERKDATLEEVFQNDPEALKVLGVKKSFFSFF